MRILATCLLVVIFTIFAWGQKEVILENNFIVNKAYQLEAKDYLPVQDYAFLNLEKSLCSEPEDGFISVLSGEINEIQLSIDTFGLGGGGAYECIDCDMLSFGSAEIGVNDEGEQTDFLLFNSIEGVDVGIDTLHVQYCNTDTCSQIQEIVYLVRRAGISFYPVAITLNQNETIHTSAIEDLPGEMKCSFFIDCMDEYEGRDQVVYFTDYSMPTNDIIYHASRFAGVDSVCVVLCDEYGICDTTHLAFRLNVTSVNFPFYEDFNTDGPYPDDGQWLDKEVFVNNQFAIDPLSVGVATFDGIDYRGSSYGGGFGPSDRLTSTYIDVPSSATFPTLSFWYQRGGLADRPETSDSLVVQFKNQAGNWVSVLKLKGINSSVSTSYVDTFKFRAIPLGPDFQYNRFQFRFLAHSDGTGYRDNWHVDYVRLDNNPLADSLFNDLSFTKKPGFLLNNYTSMPWRHFKPIADSELRQSIDIGIYNHFAETQNASPSSVKVEESTTGSAPLAATTLFNGLQSNIENSGLVINRTYDLMGDVNGFPNIWSDYFINMTDNIYDDLDEVNFDIEYTLENSSQNNADFVVNNDRVSHRTSFSNYFSYDDGTAELALETEPGLQFAVAYSAAEADTITGVQFMFPFTGVDITEQEFRLRIWIGELDDDPDYDEVYNPVYPSAFFDTIQGFTSYRLLDEIGLPTTLAIPEGPFYVGWQQKSTCSNCIGVGYDLNRPQGRDFISANNGNGWVAVDNLKRGALMIRPVVIGGDPIGATALQQELATFQVNVFPNPSQGVVYLQTKKTLSESSEIRLFNATGQLLLKEPFQQKLNISHLPEGIYFLQIFDSELQLTVRERLLIVK